VSFENEPLCALPPDLQKRRRELQSQQKEIERQLKENAREIKDHRARCKHEARPGTEGHYATYCRHCGFMMDTWL